MKISNEFLERATNGLEQGNIWITTCPNGIAVRQKDYLPIRILKSWAKNIASFFGTSFFGRYIYSDIRVDLVLDELRCANWAGVDPQKARVFFAVFEKATKRQFSSDSTWIISSYRKKIIEDTFVQNWTQKNNGFQVLMDIPQLPSEVDVSIGDRDFSVASDRLGHVRIFDAYQKRELISIALYKGNKIEASLSSCDLPSVDANILEQVLLKAHKQLKDSDDVTYQQIVDLTEEQQLKFSDLMQILLKNPNELPFKLEDVKIDFEGFTYTPFINLFIPSEYVLHRACIVFIGEKAGRVNRQIVFFLHSSSERRVNWAGRFVTKRISEWILKRTFFNSDISSFTSVVHKQLSNLLPEQTG